MGLRRNSDRRTFGAPPEARIVAEESLGAEIPSVRFATGDKAWAHNGVDIP